MGARVLMWSIACLAAIATLPAWSGAFVWDDTLLITGNPALISGEPSYFWSPFFPENPHLGSLYAAIVRPVVKVEHYLIYHAFGPSPVAFHLVNVGLHAACIVLAYRWLARRVPGARPLAIAAGLLVFALHPSRVESVAWISGSPDLWMTLFVLLSLEAAHAATRSRNGIGVGLCVFLACLSKEPALALAPWLFLEHRASGRRAAARATLVGAGLAAALLFGAALSNGLPAANSTGSPLWMPLAALGHQLRDLVWPWAPTFSSLVAQNDGVAIVPPRLAIVTGSLFLAGAAIVAWRAWARRAAVTEQSTVAGDLAWFLLPLAPTLLAPTYSPRFLYLPLLGVAALLVRWLAPLTERAAMGLRAALAVTAGLLAVVMFSESRAFADPSALWQSQYERQPDNPIVLDNHGKALEAAGDMALAKQVFSEGVARTVAPSFARKHLHLALHVMRLEVLRPSEANQSELRALRRAFERLGEDGVLEQEVGEVQIARAFDAADLEAELGSVHLFRFPYAISQARTGDLQGAITTLRAITEQVPTYTAAWNALVLCEARRFDFERARQTLASAQSFLTPESLRSLTKSLQRAEGLLRPDPSAVVNRVRALLELRAPELARTALAALGTSVDPSIVHLGMQVEIYDGAYERAAEILEAAASAAPDGEHWSDMRRALEQARQP